MKCIEKDASLVIMDLSESMERLIKHTKGMFYSIRLTNNIKTTGWMIYTQNDSVVCSVLKGIY